MAQRAQAVLQKSVCKLCKAISPANFRCIECVVDMCARCKTSHQRIPSTKDHTFQQVNDLLSPCVSDCADKSLVLCSVHQKNVILYCLSCTKFVCPECIPDEHDKHVLNKIVDIYNKKKPSFDMVSNDAKAYKSELISKKDFIINQRKNLPVKLESLRSTIEQRKQQLIAKIQNQAEDFFVCLDINNSKALRSISILEKTLNTKISEIEISLTVIDKDMENKARCILEFEDLERKLMHRFNENLTLPTAEMVFEDKTNFKLGHLKIQNVTTDLETCSCCHNVITRKLVLPICKHVLCQECGGKVRDSRICPVCQYSYQIKKREQPTGHIIVEVRDACYVIRYSFVDKNKTSNTCCCDTIIAR